jgi:PIN domain nuclease of toxin-antitoxin system
MEYLLDTHILLWWLNDPKKIRKKAHGIIADRENKVYVSSVSFWEIAIKNSLGRINIPRNMLKILSEDTLEILPLYPEETLLVTDLPDLHKDPFDRMLIAQAKFNDLVLITRDRVIPKYPVVTIAG